MISLARTRLRLLTTGIGEPVGNTVTKLGSSPLTPVTVSTSADAEFGMPLVPAIVTLTRLSATCTQLYSEGRRVSRF